MTMGKKNSQNSENHFSGLSKGKNWRRGQLEKYIIGHSSLIAKHGKSSKVEDTTILQEYLISLIENAWGMLPLKHIHFETNQNIYYYCETKHHWPHKHLKFNTILPMWRSYQVIFFPYLPFSGIWLIRLSSDLHSS